MNGLTDPTSPVSSSSVRLLFSEQQKFLNYFFDELDYVPVQKFCEACLACRGSILFTGVGKSGFIAQKISQTLISTGTRAMYLNPTDALHGDLGMVCQDDLIVLFSKSGNSEELIRLVPYAKAKGATLVSVACYPGCKLEQMCDMAVHLPLQRELCPFDMAPVTSTALQMVFGDTVAIALMRAKHLTQEAYAMNHPAGRIGKRLMLRVRDLMLTHPQLPLAHPEDSIMQVLGELSAKGCGCVLVVDSAGHLMGTFTDGDLRRTLQQRKNEVMETTMREAMNKQPRTCSGGMKAIDAMQAMEQLPRKVSFFPVLEGPLLVGLVTLHKLVEAGL